MVEAGLTEPGVPRRWRISKLGPIVTTLAVTVLVMGCLPTPEELFNQAPGSTDKTADAAAKPGEAQATQATVPNVPTIGSRPDGPLASGPTASGANGNDSLENRDARPDAAGTEPEAPPKPSLSARYCYRTLAEVDCYRAPLKDTRRTRVGYFHGPPE